jgi:hypothetical protein
MFLWSMEEIKVGRHSEIARPPKRRQLKQRARISNKPPPTAWHVTSKSKIERSLVRAALFAVAVEER